MREVLVRETLIGARRLALAIAVPVVIADRLTKNWAESAFADQPQVIIPGLLDFRFAQNDGMAFSFFQGGGRLLGIAALGASVLIWYMVGTASRRVEVAALGLILGGAVGNVVDRMIRGDGTLDGFVVDWINFRNFPTFNLADSAITVGAVLLIWAAYRRP